MTTDMPNDTTNEPMGHLGEDAISDFAEGALTGREEAAAAEHLASCPRCREEFDWIRTLRERIRELPEEVEPPRDAWAGIEARIRSGSRPPLDELSLAREQRRRGQEGRDPEVTGEGPVEGLAGQAQPRTPADRNAGDERRGLGHPAGGAGRMSKGTKAGGFRRAFAGDGATLLRAAAIVLLMALPAGATWLIMRAPMEDVPGQVADAERVGEPRAGTVEGDLRFVAQTPEMVAEAYEPAIRELRDILEANRDRLQPGTIEILEENLRIIDGAIQDFYGALEADPANIDTARLLNGMYETKIQLLRQATSLVREV